MEEKKLIVFVLLSMAILFAWQYFFIPKTKPQPREITSEKEITREIDQKGSEHRTGKSPIPGTYEKQPGDPAAITPSTETDRKVRIAPSKDIPLETDLYNAVINTLTGGFRSFSLKKYKKTTEKDSLQLELISSGLGGDELPLTLETDFGGRPFLFNKGFAYSTKEANLLLREDIHDKKLTMTARGGGVELTRTYFFRKSEYMIDMELVLRNITTKKLEGKVSVIWSTHTSEGEGLSRFQSFKPVTLTAGKLKSAGSIGKVIKEESISYENVRWIGFSGTYFARLIIPERKAGVTETEKVVNETLWQRLSIQPVEINANSSEVLKYRLYLGPKQYGLLKTYEDDVGEVVEFGMLAPIVKVFLVMMKAFYGVFHNWGVAIILVTLLVRVAMFPLTQKQYASMKAMQALQPKMKELKDKHKDNKEQLNKEMMNLYKVHKVNPLGGCLPLIVQLPIFFALYKVLYVAIELRHAPFIWWINDLSAPESLFVLPIFGGVHFGIMPILMGGSMFLQQKMSPTAMDPMQAKMMMLMPVVFTAMSFTFPSGLVLYWTFSNAFGILQQWMLTRKKN